jgi:hypothetical protein
MFKHDPSRYCSYLLRCWQEESVVHAGSAAWRFSLEDPRTGERHGFAAFEALMAFLHQTLIDTQHIAPSVAPGEEVERRDDD